MGSDNGPDGSNRQIARRVSRQVRIWKVLQMKMMGATDRQIQKTLAEDVEHPIKISHMQVNRDWHDALDEVNQTNKKQAEHLRMLMAIRLERLLMGQWDRASKPGAPVSVVEMCRRIIKDEVELFGLAREIGDPDRPLTIDDTRNVDYDKISDEDLSRLLEIAERLEGPAIPLGDDGAEIPGS
jgi:hypothetical protein